MKNKIILAGLCSLLALPADAAPHWVPIGDGVCDWAGQMAALARDGIVDHVTIENHCGPLKEVGLRNLETLRGHVARTAD